MKINELKVALEKKKSGCAVFFNSDSSRKSPNLLYFAGYGGLGALAIPSKKQPFLIVPEMEFQRAKKSMIGKVYSMERKNFFGSVYKIIRKNNISVKSVAIDKNNFTLGSFKHFKRQFRKSKIKDISPDCMKLRVTKTGKEMQFLKKSCNYADKLVQKAIRDFSSFKTESEAAAFLEYEAKKLGLGLSFDPIVASGSNGSMPHHEPSSARLKDGFCILDFGVKYKGYCSDITRTIFIGTPSGKEKEMYNMLLEIQKAAISEVHENKKCSELYDFVAGKLGKYKKYFVHGLGHGVGVEIHEMPNLAANSKDKIQNSMAFTVEPGIYFPKKFGIRIEDTIFFKNKPIPLTKTSKDLIIV